MFYGIPSNIYIDGLKFRKPFYIKEVYMFNWIKKLFSFNKKNKKPNNKKPMAAFAAKDVDADLNSLALKTVAKIQYLLNDPTTSDQIISMVPPTPSTLKMNINGYKGGGFGIETLQGQAAGCYVTITNTAKFLISKIKTKTTFGKWAAVSILNVNPRAGKDFNAYYDRSSLKFFYDTNKATKKMVYTCQSADVVAHEFGHAFLDIIRPDLWSAQHYEAWAFHESFGDIVAILNIMQYDQVLQKALRDTGNDMSKSNIVSRLAEELGKAIGDVTGDTSYSLSLRDAANNFNWVDPKTLPDNAPNASLSNECHSFSRVWTGAWYECMVEMYKKNVADRMAPLEALKLARDTAATYILHAAQYANTIKFFESLASQMINYDMKKNGSKYLSVLNSVFSKRNIIKPVIKILGEESYKSIMKKSKSMIVTEEQIDGGFVCKVKSKKIAKKKNNVFSLSNKKDEFSVDLPDNSLYLFDSEKNLVHSIETSDDDVDEMTKFCVSMLERKGHIGSEDSKMFEIKNRKLVRKKIAGCKCMQNNACDPNAPEYGKAWKGENNAGCGSKGVTVDCECKGQEQPAPVKSGCFITTNACDSISKTVCSTVSRRVC